MNWQRNTRTPTGVVRSVIAALQDVLNIRNDDIFEAATGLATGGAATIDGSNFGSISLRQLIGVNALLLSVPAQ